MSSNSVRARLRTGASRLGFDRREETSHLRAQPARPGGLR